MAIHYVRLLDIPGTTASNKADILRSAPWPPNVLRGGCEINEAVAMSHISHAHPRKSAESKSSALWYAPCNIGCVGTSIVRSTEHNTTKNVRLLMKLDSLEKLYVQELKDLHSAETQLLDAIPKMEAAATDKGLKEAFAHHLNETKTHVTRLESIFEGMDFEPGGHRCTAMEGIIKEGTEVINSDTLPKVLDAALVAAAQRVEHYEIAGYGTARAYAEKLGNHEDADVLQKTLEEEGTANRTLTRLAERHINFLATVPGK